MSLRWRIAFYCLGSTVLVASGAYGQQRPPLPWPPRSPVAIPDEALPPLTDTTSLRLTLDGNGKYVLGTDPLLVRVSLTTTGDDLELLWRASAPQRVLTGLTYKITGPDGQSNLVKTCRAGQDVWNTTRNVSEDHPFVEEIDLAADNCSDFKLTRPGHYSIQVDLKRPVCPGGSAHGCLITDEYGEFSMLTIMSDRFEFDVLPAYASDNPAPSKTSPPEIADTQIDRWLNSGNSRMVAWAAYFILRDHRTGDVGKLQAWLESAIARNYLLPASWSRSWFPGEKDSELDQERSRAALAVLDVLVQSHAALSDAQIQKIALNEPVLALIFAMQPTWNEAAVLNIFDLTGGLAWGGQTGNAGPDYSARFYAQDFAAKALALSSSRKFLDRLTAGLVLNLDFEVMPEERKQTYFQIGPNFMTRFCGGGDGYVSQGETIPGWPPIGNYGLSEGVPRRVTDSTNPPSIMAFDPADAFSLGRGDLYFTRLISERYGAAVFASKACSGDDAHDRWIELYGHYDERFETRAVFFVTGDDDYHYQLTKWVSELGAKYVHILSDAGAPPTSLNVRLHGIDFTHPAPGSNVSEPSTFNFSGFPPAGVTVVSR